MINKIMLKVTPEKLSLISCKYETSRFDCKLEVEVRRLTFTIRRTAFAYRLTRRCA